MIKFEAPGTLDAEAFHLIAQTKNPPISKNTNAIWIFSARHDINQVHLNCGTNPTTFQPLANLQSIVRCDKEDDYIRVNQD